MIRFVDTPPAKDAKVAPPREREPAVAAANEQPAAPPPAPAKRGRPPKPKA